MRYDTINSEDKLLQYVDDIFENLENKKIEKEDAIHDIMQLALYLITNDRKKIKQLEIINSNDSDLGKNIRSYLKTKIW